MFKGNQLDLNQAVNLVEKKRREEQEKNKPILNELENAIKNRDNFKPIQETVRIKSSEEIKDDLKFAKKMNRKFKNKFNEYSSIEEILAGIAKEKEKQK